MDKTQEIRKALEAATPGKWEVNNMDMAYSNEVFISANAFGYQAIATGLKIDDAHLIANTPSWLSYLLTELDTANKRTKSADMATERRQRKVESLQTQLKQAIEALEELYCRGEHIPSIGNYVKHTLSLIREEAGKEKA